MGDHHHGDARGTGAPAGPGPSGRSSPPGPPAPGIPPAPAVPGSGAGGWAPPPGPGAAPAWGPPGGGWAPAPGGHGPPGATLRRRPGAGLLIGAAGLLLFVLSLTVLDFAQRPTGEGLTIDELRRLFIDMRGWPRGQPWFTAYVRGLCWFGLAWVAVALVFSTFVVPAGQAARLVVWGLLLGVVGLVAAGLDREGRVAPRLCGAAIALAALALHVGSANDYFGEELSPADPGPAVWAGAVGLLLVAVGCAVGTRDERVPARV